MAQVAQFTDVVFRSLRLVDWYTTTTKPKYQVKQAKVELEMYREEITLPEPNVGNSRKNAITQGNG